MTSVSQDRFWNWASVQLGPLLIGRSLGAASLGMYSVAQQLSILPSQHLASVASGVYFPLLSREVREQRSPVTMFGALFAITFLITATIGIFCSLNSQAVIKLILGQRWGEAAAAFAILSIGAPLRAGTQIADSLNVANGKVQQLALCRAAHALCLACGLLLLLGFGLAGAAAAAVLAQAAMLAMTLGLALLSSDVSLRAAVSSSAGKWLLRSLLLITASNLALNHVARAGDFDLVTQVMASGGLNAVLVCGLVHKFLVSRKSAYQGEAN